MKVVFHSSTITMMHGPINISFDIFVGFAGVSYERFIAVRFGFNLSTYVHNRW